MDNVSILAQATDGMTAHASAIPMLVETVVAKLGSSPKASANSLYNSKN